MTVAIVAAGASIVVAVVSFLSSRTAANVSANTSKELEILKQSLAASKERRSVAFASRRENLIALGEAVASIQQFKDELLLILMSTRKSLDCAEALARVEGARDELLKSFTKRTVELAENETRDFHRAKNLAIHIEQFLQESFENREYASEITEKQHSSLLRLRGDLTDAQNLLRDSRADKLVSIALESDGANA